MSSRGVTGDPAVQEELRRLEETAKLRARENLREVLSTSAGRSIIWGLIDEQSGAFGPSFAMEPVLTAFREGRRSIGVELLQLVQAEFPELYLLMLQEEIHTQRAAAVSRRRAEHLSEDNDNG